MHTCMHIVGIRVCTHVCIHSQAKYHLHAYLHIDFGLHRTVITSEWGRVKKNWGIPGLEHHY